jgi:ankyrin repeat protein
MTPLHAAVCAKQPSAAKLLVENGADIQARCRVRDVALI